MFAYAFKALNKKSTKHGCNPQNAVGNLEKNTEFVFNVGGVFMLWRLQSDMNLIPLEVTKTRFKILEPHHMSPSLASTCFSVVDLQRKMPPYIDDDDDDYITRAHR